jgi:hypothetical protein
LIAIGLGWGTAAACGASRPTEANAITVLTEQSAGVAQVRIGTPVEIRLKAQFGTGFSWVPKESRSMVSPMAPMKGSAMPGGWQIQRYRFTAQRSGIYRVSFSYDQPWAGGIKGAHAKTFTIHVQ